MKRFILLITLITLCLAGMAQDPRYEWVDSLVVDSVTGSPTDTVLYPSSYGGRNANWGGRWSAEYSYIGLDADDATLEPGGTNWTDSTNCFNAWDDNSIPFTLDVTSNTVTINGDSKCLVAWSKAYFPFKKFGIRITFGSVTSGTIYWNVVIL